jgi:heme/copper-type cytochrome/quinol oxidase subunit 2
VTKEQVWSALTMIVAVAAVATVVVAVAVVVEVARAWRRSDDDRP